MVRAGEQSPALFFSIFQLRKVKFSFLFQFSFQSKPNRPTTRRAKCLVFSPRDKYFITNWASLFNVSGFVLINSLLIFLYNAPDFINGRIGYGSGIFHGVSPV